MMEKLGNDSASKEKKGKKSGAEAITFFSQFLSSVMGLKHDGNTKDAQSHRITSLRCVGGNSPNHITLQQQQQQLQLVQLQPMNTIGE